MYKALIDIGEFKKGDEVPNEIAEIWNKMYKCSPVEFSNEKVRDKEKVVEKVNIVEISENNPMLDDYLARNTHVVVKNIKSDNLSSEQLKKLLKIEKSLKKRKEVIKTINKKLEVKR